MLNIKHKVFFFIKREARPNIRKPIHANTLVGWAALARTFD